MFIWTFESKIWKLKWYSKMMSSTFWTSHVNRNYWKLWNDECHTNLRNFEFCPKGPSEEKDGGECFAPQVYIFFCAAARRQPQKVRHRRQKRAQMFKNLKIWHTENMHMSFFIHNILITSWTNDDSSWKLYWIAAFGTYEMFWSIWNQNYEQRWNDEITWKWKIPNFARRAA